MILFRELVKIVKQVCGLENMFGYRTTLANQLHLMYTMLGEIYFEDKLHWQVKMAYFVPNFSQLCVAFSLCVLYSIYGFGNDLILFTQTVFFILLIIYLAVIVPLASWIFGDKIEKMIHLVDCMLIERRSSKCVTSGSEGFVDIKTALIVNFSIFFAPLLIFASAGTCDVIIFYEEEKVKNYIYYMIPFPRIHEYGSLKFLLFANVGITSFVSSVAFVQLWSVIAMPFVWAAVCHNEVIYICLGLRSGSAAFEDLKLASKTYQKISSIIKNFREFYNTLCTVTLVLLLVVGIANAYVVFLWDFPYLIKIRATSAVLVCIAMTFQLCSIGEIIYNLTNIMSCEIYSTPWYLSTKFRRDVQLFLSQAQTTFDLSAFKVYLFGLSTVLRFVNLIYSTANFLRNVT